jgi:hypothetical protein
VGLHGAPCHFQFGGNLSVVAALQEQFDDLLFARTQPYGLLLHQTFPPVLGIACHVSRAHGWILREIVASTMPF